MGLFDAPAPLFAFTSQLLTPILPAWAIVATWGTLLGALATTIYWFLAPQKRILQIRAGAQTVRNALLRYDGDFRGVLKLTRQSLALSLKELCLVSGPAIAASIPALCLIAYLGNSYDYFLPPAGTTIPVRVKPANAAVRWNPPMLDPHGVWMLQWPKSGSKTDLISSRGRTLATFPLSKPVPVIQKFVWWNLLFGNPVGYLPRGGDVSSIEIRLKPRDFVSVGPEWIRGWETIFFFFACVSALTFRKLLAVR